MKYNKIRGTKTDFERGKLKQKKRDFLLKKFKKKQNKTENQCCQIG